MTSRPPSHHAPVLVIGAGLAGLTVALHAAQERDVIVLAKRELAHAATAWAQGGIVGVLDPEDSIEAHVADTLEAGAGLVDPFVAREIAGASRAAVLWLRALGVPFTTDPQAKHGLHLTREGGHSHRRIAHAADATGQAIHETLLAAVLAHPRIEVRERWMAIDLILQDSPAGDRLPACLGVHALDLADGQIHALDASAVVLATGGTGKVYRYTTNPESATGDGIAMAWRAGCRVANMEFIQFHPTCLYHPQDRSFLITEALRGEGALLRLPDGTRFMPDHDERAELAPRDVVARAIDAEMKRHGLDYVLLDATHLGEAFLAEHFPTVKARCAALGIDIAHDAIPVVPATHYTCGGVVTDAAGRTDLPGLYAVGETACTGLHGANRLASNSLLECVVVGQAAARALCAERPRERATLPAWDSSRTRPADETVLVSHSWDELRLLMWDYVGIVRSEERLERALARIGLLRREVAEYGSNYHLSADWIELRNLLVCAELIVRSALLRKESRGLHASRDYPAPRPAAYPSVLTPA